MTGIMANHRRHRYDGCRILFLRLLHRDYDLLCDEGRRSCEGSSGEDPHSEDSRYGSSETRDQGDPPLYPRGNRSKELCYHFQLMLKFNHTKHSLNHQIKILRDEGLVNSPRKIVDNDNLEITCLNGQEWWTGREPQLPRQTSHNQWKTSVETLIRLLSLSDNYHEFAFASS